MLNVDISSFYLDSFSLKQVKFNLKRGETLALLGLNGAGKTTLLKLIGSIYQSNTSIISWKNKVIPAHYFEYVPSFIASSLSIKTKFFLEVALEKLKITSEDRARINRITRLLKIDNLLDHDLKFLSSGEMSKVLLAKALIRKKPIILWDEPTSFLDIKYRSFLKNVIKKIKKKRIFIISTHDLKWASSISDYYLGLKNGEQLFFDKKIEKNKLKKILS